MTNIAIYGGTFNPIHNAHLRIIEQVLEDKNLQIDEFRVIPCNLPNNNKINIASNEDRLNMLELALKDKNVIIDTREFERGDISYTIDTLKSFNGNLFLVLGDEINNLEKWKDYEEILGICKIIHVSGRSKTSFRIINAYKPHVIKMSPEMDLSSTEIRELLKQNKSIKYLTPDLVVDYIQEKGLYNESSN